MNKNEKEIEKAKEVLEVMDIEERGNAICSKCVFDYDKKCYDENGDCQMIAIETLLQYIEQLEQENNKQNKIIDEMTKQINKAYFDENNFCLWFEKYITKQKPSCLSDRIKTIKQYFEKKVEEE